MYINKESVVADLERAYTRTIASRNEKPKHSVVYAYLDGVADGYNLAKILVLMQMSARVEDLKKEFQR